MLDLIRKVMKLDWEVIEEELEDKLLSQEVNLRSLEVNLRCLEVSKLERVVKQ